MFIAVGDESRGNTDIFSQLERPEWIHRQDLDVAPLRKVAPWKIVIQEAFHSREGVNRGAPGPHDFVSQVDEPRVVADVGVGQKKAGAVARNDSVKKGNLAGKCRGAVDDPA